VKFGRDHDDIAFRMRVLRVHLILARTKINGHHPTKPAKEPLA
jgi:hypothetical protein